MADYCGFSFVLVFIVQLGTLVVECKNSDGHGLSKDGLTLTVQHAIDTGSELVFNSRGVINIKNIKGVSASYMNEEEIPTDDISNLKTAAGKGNFYHIRIPIVSQDENEDKKEVYVSTFIKACSLLMSNLSDIIKLQVDNSGNIFAVGLSTTTADCSNYKSHKPSIRSFDHFNTTVILSHVTPGPIPDTQTYIRKLEDERREKQRGKSKDNRSFFGKYWMYIVPLVIFVMLSGQEQPPAGGGGGGAPAAAAN